jgi:hypothetical protein
VVEGRLEGTRSSTQGRCVRAATRPPRQIDPPPIVIDDVGLLPSPPRPARRSCVSSTPPTGTARSRSPARSPRQVLRADAYRLPQPQVTAGYHCDDPSAGRTSRKPGDIVSLS